MVGVKADATFPTIEQNYDHVRTLLFLYQQPAFVGRTCEHKSERLLATS
jgi:hypothetical protein